MFYLLVWQWAAQRERTPEPKHRWTLGLQNVWSANLLGRCLSPDKRNRARSPNTDEPSIPKYSTNRDTTWSPSPRGSSTSGIFDLQWTNKAFKAWTGKGTPSPISLPLFSKVLQTRTGLLGPKPKFCSYWCRVVALIWQRSRPFGPPGLRLCFSYAVAFIRHHWRLCGLLGRRLSFFCSSPFCVVAVTCPHEHPFGPLGWRLSFLLLFPPAFAVAFTSVRRKTFLACSSPSRQPKDSVC